MIASACRCSKSTAPVMKAGDIIGWSGNTWLSAGINLATYGIPYWGLSHIGILADCDYFDEFPGGYPFHYEYPHRSNDEDIKLLLFESLIECDVPCAIQGKQVRGTQAHHIGDRITREACCHEKIWHYPLYRELRPLESRRLTGYLIKHLGKDYDAIGAFRAGGIGFSFIESLLRKADLSSFFCSEQCAGAHKHIGLLSPHGLGEIHASRWSPNLFTRTEVRHGIILKPTRLRRGVE